MNVNELITNIFQVCILPLLGIITTFLVKWFQAKMEEIKTTNDDIVLNKYMDMLADTITDCVIATNQTYVDSLKAQGKFDAEAQKKAFEMTYNSVINILTDEAKVYLTSIYGDLTAYITNMIEAEVNKNKK